MNTERTDLDRLIDDLPFDAETIENLASADLGAMRAMLSTYLPDDQVDAIVERIRRLTTDRP